MRFPYALVAVSDAQKGFDRGIVEALMQLCTHGTHHRAQLVNMLRQAGRQVPESDLIAWWRRQP